MRTFWLSLAGAMLVITAPAQAQSWDGDHHGRNGGRDHHHAHHNGSVFGPTVFADASNNQHGHFDNNSGGFVDDWGGGQWALYNNQSWQPDSYNDWWNDRPDRAYPRWMSRNQDCSRQWYSGDTLRC